MRTQTSVALLHCDRAAAHLSKPLQTEISSTITVQERSGRTSVFILIDSQNMCIKPANSQNKPSLKRHFLFTATAEELESLKEPLFQAVKLLSFSFFFLFFLLWFITNNWQIPLPILKEAEKIDKHLRNQTWWNAEYWSEHLFLLQHNLSAIVRINYANVTMWYSLEEMRTVRIKLG